MKEATPTQREVLQYWQDYRETHGYWPTGREAARHLGKAQVTIFEITTTCIKKGLLERTGACLYCNLCLTDAGEAALGPRKPHACRWTIAGTLSDRGIAWKGATPQ